MLRDLTLPAALAAATLLAACGDAATESPADTAGTGAATAPAATAPDADGPLVVYCGRSESLLGPVLAAWNEANGRDLEVRYADTAALVATILEEGDASPCDVYIAQDAGALGALSDRGLFRPLDAALLDRVPAWLRSDDGLWVGVSGRARVVAYSTERVADGELPDSILDFTDPRWKGRIGWPPKNGSFQAFVTALRVRLGEDGAKAWLEGIVANEPKEYPKNSAAVAAIAAGEIDVAFVNHYYLFRFLAEQGATFPVRNALMAKGDAGNLVNTAGAGILATSKRPAAAAALIEHLLSTASQEHFASTTYEYPVVDGVATHALLQPLEDAGHGDIDLDRLEDLPGTLALLRSVGILR